MVREFVLATQWKIEICTFGKISTGNTRWGVGASNNEMCTLGICTGKTHVEFCDFRVCTGNTVNV